MTAIAVETLAAARQNLKRTSFDALFLDLNLGEHAGLALAREISARPAHGEGYRFTERVSWTSSSE